MAAVGPAVGRSVSGVGRSRSPPSARSRSDRRLDPHVPPAVRSRRGSPRSTSSGLPYERPVGRRVIVQPRAVRRSGRGPVPERTGRSSWCAPIERAVSRRRSAAGPDRRPCVRGDARSRAGADQSIGEVAHVHRFTVDRADGLEQRCPKPDQALADAIGRGPGRGRPVPQPLDPSLVARTLATSAAPLPSASCVRCAPPHRRRCGRSRDRSRSTPGPTRRRSCGRPTSWSNPARSVRDPPPRTRSATSTPRRVGLRSARDTPLGPSGPCVGQSITRTSKP